MCGLVGVMGHIGEEQRGALRDLLIVDVLRGKHSTGIATVERQGDVAVVKKAVNAVDFLDMGVVNGALIDTNNCIIGHNRYATLGAVNNINAHPFEFDKLVGAHNGTLSCYKQLDNDLYYDVDSECLYAHINDHGIDDAFSKCAGAMALTWYDKETGRLNLFRNKERPLCYTFSKDLRTLYWASEGWMLTSILWRNGLDHTDVVYINEDTLYSFVVPKGFVRANDKLEAPTIRKVVKEKKTTRLGGTKSTGAATLGGTKDASGTWAEYCMLLDSVVNIVFEQTAVDKHKHSYLECSVVGQGHLKVRVYAETNTAVNDLLHQHDGELTCKIKSYKSNGGQYLLPDLRTISVAEELELDEDITVDGYNGEKLTFTQFRQATGEGCAWCSGNAEFGKPVAFISQFDFLCHECLEKEEVKEYI